MKKTKEAIYQLTVANIFGKKYWISVFLVFFFMNFTLLYDTKKFEFFDLDQTTYFLIFLADLFYFLLSIYFYFKEFSIYPSYISMKVNIGPITIRKVQFSIDQIESIICNEFSNPSPLDQRGQIVFIQKKNFFRRYSFLQTKIIVPIHYQDASAVLSQIVKNTYSPHLLLIKKHNKDFIRLQNRLVIGRNSTPHFCKEEKLIGRRHALITQGSDKHYYLEDLNSINKTYLNNQELIPKEKYLLHQGDKVVIGKCEFFIDHFQLQKFVTIKIFNTSYFLLPLLSFAKISFYTSFITIGFIPSYLIYNLYFTSRDSSRCSKESKAYCGSVGFKEYQLGNFKKSLPFLSQHCERPYESKNSQVAKSCFYAYLANEYVSTDSKKIYSKQRAGKFLKKSCELRSIVGCARHAVNIGDTSLYQKSVEELEKLCSSKKDGDSCKDLSNISAVVKAKKESFDYLKQAIINGYDRWWSIHTDPELQSVLASKDFTQFMTDRKRYWKNWERSEEPFPLTNDEYFEFLKITYFWKYDKSMIQKTCPLENTSPTGPSSALTSREYKCSRIVLREFVQYANIVPSQNVLDIADLVIPIFKHEKKMNGSEWDQLDLKLNELEFETLFYNQLRQKPLLKLPNLIGNILFFFKIRFDVLDSMSRKITDLNTQKDHYQKLFVTMKRDQPDQIPLFKDYLKRWTILEDRYYRYSHSHWRWEIEKRLKAIERRIERILDNVGDLEQMK
jgi:hypothetical protein